MSDLEKLSQHMGKKPPIYDQKDTNMSVGFSAAAAADWLRARQNTPPKLPRVSPENLVEGEEYRIELDFEFGGTAKSKCQSVAFLDGEFWPFGYDVAFERKSVVNIWGPIPRFELEGE